MRGKNKIRNRKKGNKKNDNRMTALSQQTEVHGNTTKDK